MGDRFIVYAPMLNRYLYVLELNIRGKEIGEKAVLSDCALYFVRELLLTKV